MVFLKLSRKDFEVDDAVLRDGDRGGRFAIEASAGEHRRMLHGRQIAVPGLPGLRGERERVRLGAAAGEDHVLGSRADQRRHLRARRPRSPRAPPCPRHAPTTDCRRATAPRSRPRGLLREAARWRYSRDRNAGSCSAEARGQSPPVNACTSPRRACYEARPEVRAAPSAQLFRSGLVWNNSNLKLYRIPERQSQVLRRRFRVSHLPCASAL